MLDFPHWCFDDKIPRTYFPYPGPAEAIVNKLIVSQHKDFPHLQESKALPLSQFQELYYHKVEQDYVYSYFRMQDDDGNDYYCLACRSALPIANMVEISEIRIRKERGTTPKAPAVRPFKTPTI
jgi:hypothetical protein